MPLLTPRRRRLLAASFLVYIALLTWVVLWKLEIPRVGWGGRHVKLVPFVADELYAASAPREVLANVALFVPFGVHLRLLGTRWFGVLATAAATSAGLEIAQYVLAVGSTDTTDVIANTSGALVGLVVTGLALHRRGLGLRHRALTRVSVAATTFALVACAAYAAGPIRYGPPDVHCDPSGTCQVGHRLAR